MESVELLAHDVNALGEWTRLRKGLRWVLWVSQRT